LETASPALAILSSKINKLMEEEMMHWRKLILLGLLAAGLASCSAFQQIGVNRDPAVPPRPRATEPESFNLPIPATAVQDTVASATPQPVQILPPPTSQPEQVLEIPSLSVAPGGAYYGYVFVPQPGTPASLRNFTRPEAGCNWMGVGGQLFGLDGWPLQHMLVEISGQLAGQQVSALALTGSATQWGPGGYEFTLGNAPVASTRSLWVQVHDLDNRTLSDRIFFDTFTDCDRNATLINMVQVTLPIQDLPYTLYLNAVFKQAFIAEEMGGGYGE
jgi:hypothetical protein